MEAQAVFYLDVYIFKKRKKGLNTHACQILLCTVQRLNGSAGILNPLCIWHTLQPKEKVGIRGIVVKYEMKAPLEGEDWIMFHVFASVPLDTKKREHRERDLLSQDKVQHIISAV